MVSRKSAVGIVVEADGLAAGLEDGQPWWVVVRNTVRRE